jgi:tetrapyrrole methylase family protein/MazG family protein
MEKNMPAGITLIGLGPGDSQQWTQAVAHVLGQAGEVYLRTGRHLSAADIAAQVRTFDAWYDQKDNFEQVNQQVAAKIVQLGQRDEGVVYAVPGHPDIGEATVPLIRALAKTQQLEVVTLPGLSFIEPTLTALNLAGLHNLQIADAVQIAASYHPALEQDRAALIANLHSQAVALGVKQALLNLYPADFQVTLVQAAGTKFERVWSCPLAQLENQPKLDMITTVYLPAETNYSSLSTFQEIIAHLRAPNGCPWDRAQTHQSLRPYLLEETYEVLEALDAGDSMALAEELGDLLLQILLHTQIATDQGEFKMGTVIEQISRKMLRRHPHVFGDVVIQGLGELYSNWEAIKQAEKAEKGQANAPVSALDGVPAGLPALAQAMAISKKAVQAGFEWDNIEGVLAKIVEEAGEVAEAAEPEHLEAEIGDLLFCIVNLARWRKIDPESALRATNARFSRRFKIMEALAVAQGKTLSELTTAEMEALWKRAKADSQTAR